MENNEKKIDAVELNDENLENVSGGDAKPGTFQPRCGVCGEKNGKLHCYRNRYYCPACKEKAGF